MKFLLPLLTFGLASASKRSDKHATAVVDNVPVDSSLGSKIMANARSLENDVDFTWVAGFSIKFQGCHHVNQWNEEADGEEDVRIQTKRLIRFRLCPSSSCTASAAAGCTSDYGDYIIDMNTFLDSYYEAVEDTTEYNCEYTAQITCGCVDKDDDDDAYDRDICEYECFAARDLIDECDARNPYDDDGEEEEEEKFELREYIECAEAEFDQDERRHLEEEEMQYFIGPYCSEDGGAIFLGMFTDDTCTTFADSQGGDYTYKQLTGISLPYSSDSVITMDCLSCKEPEDLDNNNDGNDAEDGDEVIEMCEQVYQTAGKCESGLAATGYVYEANENACNYIAGIKTTYSDGTIRTESSANKTASIFIGIFIVSFFLLAAYIFYLKTKLDRASINLSE